MDRRKFLRSAAAAAAPAFSQRSQPPNIVLILADDLGWGDLSCYGNPYIHTPRIDRMAAEGVRFTDFYAQPLCGPSRAAILTGCYPVRNSLMFNHIPRARTGIHPGEITVAEHLKNRGYATAIAGKWHLGDAPPFRPLRHGFDTWLGLPYSNDMWPFHPKTVRAAGENPRLTAARTRAELTGYDGQGQTYPADWFPDLPLMSDDQVLELNPDQRTLTTRYTDKAVGFIRSNRARPFFLYLAHAMPHAPLFADPNQAGQSPRGLYGDVVRDLDRSTGRILDTLRELGLDRRTLVIFTSDNGPWLPYGIDAGSAGPFRAGKGTHFEGGIRVPMIARWPDRIPPGRVTSEFASTIDFFATFGALAGVPPPTDRVIDSLDVSPLLFDPAARSPRDSFFIYEGAIAYRPETGRPRNSRILKAIRSGPWKLHVETMALYHLHSDPGESKDVAGRNRDVVDRLLAMGRRFDDEIARNTRPLGEL